LGESLLEAALELASLGHKRQFEDKLYQTHLLAPLFTALVIGAMRENYSSSIDSPPSATLSSLCSIARDCCLLPFAPRNLHIACSAFLHKFLPPQEKVEDIRKILGGGLCRLDLHLSFVGDNEKSSPQEAILACQVHALDMGLKVEIGGSLGKNVLLSVTIHKEDLGLDLLWKIGEIFQEYSLQLYLDYGGETECVQSLLNPTCTCFALLSRAI